MKSDEAVRFGFLLCFLFLCDNSRKLWSKRERS